MKFVLNVKRILKTESLDVIKRYHKNVHVHVERAGETWFMTGGIE